MVYCTTTGGGLARGAHWATVTHLEKCVFFLYVSSSFGLILPDESSMACERLLRDRVGESAPSSVMLLNRIRPRRSLEARRPCARNSETLFMIIVPPPTVKPRLRSPSIETSARAGPHLWLLIPHWTRHCGGEGGAQGEQWLQLVYSNGLEESHLVRGTGGRQGGILCLVHGLEVQLDREEKK